ncbi:MAG: hypothetical protein JSS02_33195 [Planctomycetes bacterium]|nr:hypothetical protein [Planctomycetota bacterium]
MDSHATEKLQWHEPAAYRRACARRRSQEQPWERLKVAACIALGLLALYAYMVFTQPPQPNRPGWLVATVISAAGGFCSGYVFPWLILLMPNSIVILSPKGVNNNIIGYGARIRFWDWRGISGCRIGTDDIAGQSFRIIALLDGDGRELERFGLRADLDLQQVRSLLESHGKSLVVEDAPA